MNVTVEREKEIKSQRALELDELRSKGVASVRKTKLEDLVASPLTTPEEAKMFLAAMRDNCKGKKEEWEFKPHAHVTGDGMDGWFMMQRNREKEMKQRRQEAEQLLRGYRGQYITDGVNPAFSPRHRQGRASLGGGLSESLIDPMTEHKRRQSTMPRLQNHFVVEDGMEERTDDNSGRLGPERINFMSGRESCDASQHSTYTSKSYDTRNTGRSTFREGDGRYPDHEARDPAATMDASRYIDVSSSHGRLSEFSAGRSGRRSHLSTDSVSVGRELRQVPETVWRDFVSPELGAKFPSEAGRYHLFASYACPGSHRALIVRALKGLEDVVSVTIVHPTWRHTNRSDSGDKHRGWVFGNPSGKDFHNTTGRGGPFPAAYSGNDPDPILGAYSVRELYEYASDTSGKYTIPLLWDKQLGTIVNNESSDISYMLNSCFNKYSSNPDLDLYTEDDEDGLDKLNEISQWLYPMMIHGVYRCGFAKTQAAYDHAIEELTAAFDMADELLQHQRYLTGDTLTDADIRLFVTLIRFDEVYSVYFRANTRLVMLTPALLNFCREIYQMPGIADTCRMEQIKAHFYGSHAEWNKYSVIPRGLGFMKLLDLPHDRDRFETPYEEE